MVWWYTCRLDHLYVVFSDRTPNGIRLCSGANALEIANVPSVGTLAAFDCCTTSLADYTQSKLEATRWFVSDGSNSWDAAVLRGLALLSPFGNVTFDTVLVLTCSPSAISL